MATVTAAVLEPMGQARVALESVDVQASLRGLLAEVAVTQVYRNLEDTNIEAVYTFPLPLDAVLLDLSLELNGRTMRGVVQPNVAAEERYEDAIADGDSAVLLQQVEPGVFTLNVGNILPGERAVIRFQYGLLHRWQGDSLRMHLPTTIAPRYGDPAAAGLAPHQVPEHSLTADHGFSLAIAVEGELAGADFDCPSHPVAVTSLDGVRQISLSGGAALMDRDFVLVLREPEGSTIESLWAKDGDEYAVLASFHPVFPAGTPPSPRCVKLIVDCSGSMGGDSIAQAKAALHEILSLLKPTDFFNLITFGSTHQTLFPEPVKASEVNVQAAAAFTAKIDANMGGTEIGAALDAAYEAGSIEGLPSDVLLITDGEVWGHEALVEAAKRSGHRVFTVGVGSAVSEAFVRGIAQATSGACELVSPREDMADRIVRHFQRIDQPMAKNVKVVWPTDPIRQIPERVETVYAADTLHVFGWQAAVPGDGVTLEVTLEDGRTVSQSMAPSREPVNLIGGSDSLARIAAYHRLSALGEDDARELAVRYQLVTEYTSCVLVFDREEAEKSDEVPALRKVPQVLAAGWGGMGRVRANLSMAVEACASLSSPDECRLMDAFADADMEMLDVPAFLGRQRDSFEPLVSGLNSHYPDSTSANLDIQTISELVALGLDKVIGEELIELTTSSVTERHVTVAFLTAILGSKHGEGLSRHVKRLIRMAGKEVPVSASLASSMSQILRN